MVEITESQKKAVVEKLKFIQEALPEVIEIAKQGKITSVPHEEMFIIEPAIKGLTSINIKELSVIFIRCPGEEIKQEKN